MKSICAISGISFEVPHLSGFNGAAIHPALFLPLSKIQQLAHVAAFGKQPISHDEIHLLVCATIQQLSQTLTNSPIRIVGQLVKPTMLELTHSTIPALNTLLLLTKSLASLERASKLLANETDVVQLVLRNCKETPLKYSDMLLSIKEYLSQLAENLAEISASNKKALHFASSLESLPRTNERAKKLQDLQLSQLTTSNEHIKRKAVKSLLTKFGNLPSFAITSPLTGRQTNCGTYWLSLLELSDGELILIPDADLAEFRDHLIEQGIFNLLSGKVIMSQLDALITRKKGLLDMSFGMLDMLTTHGTDFVVLSPDGTALPASTAVNGQPAQSKQDTSLAATKALLANLKQIAKRTGGK